MDNINEEDEAENEVPGSNSKKSQAASDKSKKPGQNKDQFLSTLVNDDDNEKSKAVRRDKEGQDAKDSKVGKSKVGGSKGKNQEDDSGNLTQKPVNRKDRGIGDELLGSNKKSKNSEDKRASKGVGDDDEDEDEDSPSNQKPSPRSKGLSEDSAQKPRLDRNKDSNNKNYNDEELENGQNSPSLRLRNSRSLEDRRRVKKNFNYSLRFHCIINLNLKITQL